MELLAQLSHPNLVSYRHVWLENVQLTRFGPSVASAFILQQYCNGGDLLNYIIGDQPRQTTKEEFKARMRRRSKGQAERPPADPLASQRHLSFEEIYSLFKDITSGLDYLHAANYIHRDLKPSNCLLHHEGGILICLISDFGEVQPENSVRKSTGSTGTISYCAPEVLRQDPASGTYGNFTTKSDIFSLGMILYFLCFGRLPYRSANAVNEELEDIDELRAEITDWQGFQDERRERPDLPSKLYQLLKRLLALDPAQRPSTKEVLAAMKNDSSLDGVPVGGSGRSASPSSLGIQGRRVQSLDSPVVPGSPVPDPHKQQRYDRPGRSSNEVVGAADVVDDPATTLRNRDALRRNSDITALRPFARPAVSSPSRDRFSSPERPALDEQQQRSVSPHRPFADAAPPLLMAPPRTWSADLLWRASLAWFFLARLATDGGDPLPHLVRLAGFIAKVLTLSRPCWPYTISPWVGGMLVALAAFDLGVGDTPRRRNSHVVVARWQDRGQQSALSAPHARASLLLASAHFAILWAAGRWVPLCAPALEPWRHDGAG